jgi:hypothetical protein
MNFSTEGSARLKKNKASRVPEQTRVYNHGDPTHLIDWKLYARTDQLLLREHKDQTALFIGVCISYDKTMDWPTEEVAKGSMSKWEIACRVGFHLAYQHLNIGDRVKLYIKYEGSYYEVKLLSSSSVLKLFNSFDEDYSIEKLISFFSLSNLTSSKLDKFYFLSDLIETQDFFEFDYFKSLSVKHILSHLDMNQDWLDSKTFYASDESKNKKIKGSALKKDDFLKNEIESWIQNVKSKLEPLESYYQLLTDETSLDEYLNAVSWEMKA